LEVREKVIVVTGGTGGIGRALCARFVRDGARAVVISDLDATACKELADQLGSAAVGISADVTREADVVSLVETTLAKYGPIDLFCSNAGVTAPGTEQAPDEDWTRLWNINLMGHVYAARAVLPSMLERGSGYLLQTSSAAGLMTEIGSAAYSVTKHAAVSFAEWLSVRYRRKGIRVSCLCPAGVATEFLKAEDPIHQFLATSALTPDDVAESVVEALWKETFLVLPHHQVAEFFRFKGEDYDRWLHNFSRISEKLDRIAAKKQG
jgi:NAD(P)-dependent dehydrogenase (short-subunit alcohol dehydrogenase family)